MSKNNNGIDELLSFFQDTLSPADVLSSKMMAQISTAITKERLKLHMNQADFAKHIHASQSLVSRWESGDYNFTIQKIAEIAASLNLDVDITLHDANTQNTQSIAYSSSSSGFTKTIYCSQKNNYSSRSFSEMTSNNFSKKQEDSNYASVR